MSKLIKVLTSPFHSLRTLFKLVVTFTLALGLIISVQTFASDGSNQSTPESLESQAAHCRQLVASPQYQQSWKVDQNITDQQLTEAVSGCESLLQHVN